MELLILMLLIVAIWAVPFTRAVWRGYRETSSSSPDRSKTKPYTLWAGSAGKIQPMAKPTKRKITFRDERDLAASRQRVWMRYEDYNGNESERKIEVYCPKEDDNYIFAWCCFKQAPRTFNRNNILAWQVLNEHFDFDPLVERYFQEEGQRDREDKIPWQRWKERHERRS